MKFLSTISFSALCIVALISCRTTENARSGTGAARRSSGGSSGPSIPSSRELAQDPAWIKGCYKAEYVYLPNAPTGWRSADWIPLDSNYEDKGIVLKGYPLRKFAEGHGKLVLREQALSLSNVFKAENNKLEVIGDWHHGRLVRTVNVIGAEELAHREYNWTAIGTGLAIGAAPLVAGGWVGKKLVEAVKEGAPLVAEEASRASAAGAYKCPRCDGYGKVDAGPLRITYDTCPRCDGNRWLRNGMPYNARP